MRYVMFFLLVLALPSGGAVEIVTVYTYDSFSAKGGLGAWLAEAVEKKHGIRTRFVSFASAGEALNQVALEGARTKADILVGVDQSLLGRAWGLTAFETLPVPAGVPQSLRFDEKKQFVPFDYGYLTFVYDSRRTTIAKTMSFRELARDKKLARRIVLQDPRTSSLGLSFLLWTHVLFQGAELDAFWHGLAGQIATVTPGWSGAYGLFLKKEADLVVSYTTSPAYHIEKEKTDAIRGMVFSEGHYRQIEGAGLLKVSTRKDAAKRWLELLLSKEAQARVPTMQWMYPVLEGTSLPPSFAKLPEVRAVGLDPAAIEKSKRTWLREWQLRLARP